MGILFTKESYEVIDITNNCIICQKSIENDSYILCKKTNYKYHLSCLIDDNYHLDNCNDCKKMYIYMNILNNLLK